MEEIHFSELCNFSDKQREAHKAVEIYKYLLYGGAMGGGKSYWLRWEMAWWLSKLTKKYNLNGIVGGLFCEDYPSLKDRQISKIAREFPNWLGELHADHKEYGRSFIAKPEYGSWVIALRNLDDASKYKSAEFAVEGIDELTKNKKEVFDDMKTRLRWPGILGNDCKFFSGTNPGEIGHAWVKKWWMDRDFEIEMKPLADKFFYISAKAEDNKFLDSSYLETLESLPEDKRKAYKEGDWNIFKGQYFSEWRQETHVIKPFAIPVGWKRFICGDYGYSKPSAIYWCAVDEDGNIVVYRELYVTEHTYEKLTEKIISLTPITEKIDFWVFDPAIWSKKGDSDLSGAEKIIYRFKELTGKGLHLIQGVNDRINGWGVFREYLKPIIRNGEKIAGIRFFETCINAIRTIPALVYDKNIVEDVDSDGEDHSGDSIRYGLMSRPPKTKKTYVNPVLSALNRPFINEIQITSYE